MSAITKHARRGLTGHAHRDDGAPRRCAGGTSAAVVEAVGVAVDATAETLFTAPVATFRSANSAVTAFSATSRTSSSTSSACTSIRPRRPSCCADGKSQIQALDRTQASLPIKKGRAGTMTHDYKRNGTTTPVRRAGRADRKVIGQCLARHRHEEFLTFLRTIDRAVPAPRTFPSDCAPRSVTGPASPGPRT
jgi:hypothetical protein